VHKPTVAAWQASFDAIPALQPLKPFLQLLPPWQQSVLMPEVQPVLNGSSTAPVAPSNIAHVEPAISNLSHVVSLPAGSSLLCWYLHRCKQHMHWMTQTGLQDLSFDR